MQLARYVADLSAQLWSMGADLQGEPEFLEDRLERLSFSLSAALPDSGMPESAVLSLKERWIRIRDEYERAEYAYELIDHPRRRRRAFHRHDEARFLAAFQVAVHEHCEETLGEPDCAHYAGTPVRDGFDGIERLMRAWTDDPLGCGDLERLD